MNTSKKTAVIGIATVLGTAAVMISSWSVAVGASAPKGSGQLQVVCRRLSPDSPAALSAHLVASCRVTKTVSLGVFARAGGWIAVGGDPVMAFDPAKPSTRVVLAPGYGDPLAWSPDGSKLLIVRASGLYVLRSHGGPVRVGPKGAANGSFTPDGSKVLYENTGIIYEVSSSGGPPRIVANRSAEFSYLFPGLTGGQLSPDGTTIVYIPIITGKGASGIALSLTRSDGTHDRPLVTVRRVVALTGHPDANQIAALAWFPDSRRILFQALNQSATHCALLTINTNGTNLRRWGTPGFCPMRAAISPDQHRVAFTTSQSPLEVTITTLNGRHPDKLRVSPNPGGLSLAWNSLQ